MRPRAGRAGCGRAVGPRAPRRRRPSEATRARRAPRSRPPRRGPRSRRSGASRRRAGNRSRPSAPRWQAAARAAPRPWPRPRDRRGAASRSPTSSSSALAHARHTRLEPDLDSAPPRLRLGGAREAARRARQELPRVADQGHTGVATRAAQPRLEREGELHPRGARAHHDDAKCDRRRPPQRASPRADRRSSGSGAWRGHARARRADRARAASSRRRGSRRRSSARGGPRARCASPSDRAPVAAASTTRAPARRASGTTSISSSRAA